MIWYGQAVMRKKSKARVIAGDVGGPVDQVRLPAFAVGGAMEAAADALTRMPAAERPPLEVTTDVLARLIWEGLPSLAGLAQANPRPVVPLRRRR